MTLRPFYFPELYQSIVLGTEISPGKVTLSGHDRSQDWETKQSKGAEGASTVFRGRKLAEFQATFELTSDAPLGIEDDFSRWDVFQRTLESTVAGPDPVALPIFHPDLARNNISSVVVDTIGGMQHDARGGAIVVVKFREYYPSKRRPASKAQSKPGADGRVNEPNKPKPRRDPNADAKRELDELLAEARKP